MNRKQQTFINEVLRHGDKTLAYKTAYPTAKGNSVYVGITRLMKEPEVDEILNGNLRRMRAELEAEMREKLKEEIAGELELKVSLTRIIRGQHIVPKYLWTKDGKQELEQHVGFAQLIRAIVELAKMEGLYRSAGSERAESVKERKEREAEEKRLAREEQNRQDAIWEKAMREKFNNEFKGYTYTQVQDHYKALGDFDEKEETYITRLAYSRDRENGIHNPWERTAEAGAVGSKNLPAAKNTTDSLTTTNVKNVNDENLTKLNKMPSAIQAPESSIEDPEIRIPPKDLPPLSNFQRARLRNVGWESLYQYIQNTYMNGMDRGMCKASKRVAALQELAQAMNRRDPQIYDMAAKLRLELHPIWFHWVKEVGNKLIG